MLVYGEQGLGDSLQFLRYAPILAANGARVLVAVPAPIMDIASRVEGVHAVVEPTYALPPFDFSCPLPSLALYCGTRLEDVPGAGGYLSAPPDRIAFWKDRLGVWSGPTVALAWAGNPAHPNDCNRSMSMADIAPMLQLPGVRWLSLQMGAAEAELRRRGEEVVSLGPRLADVSDTAAVVACADLVISVDTALCHLAGGMGRPTWTLLPFAPDWRWLTGRTDSPWYASMRLYRQASPRDWSGVVSDVVRDLTVLARERAA